MSMSHRKIKSVAKSTLPKGQKLSKLILETMEVVSEIVGATLGPGGCPVLIERQEYGYPNLVTKDGVTVFRSLGFSNAIAHAIMETARDASVRTATEAGDGPQPLWSKILTPTGFVEMGAVEVGTEICGTNGTVQKVIGVYPKGPKRIVKVRFEDGQTVECCEDHLWSVTTNYGSEKTLTTREMAKDFKKLANNDSYKHRYYVQKTEAHLDPLKRSLLDPYLIGVLIGDGSLSDSGSIELCLGAPKEHIISKLLFPHGISAKSSWVPEKNSFRVKITGKTNDGRTMRDLLKEIGLRNCDSYAKHIPQGLFIATVGDRKALLQGLVDTDGHVNNHGRFEFSTVSDQLADDFQFLCQSLGKGLHRWTNNRKEGDGSYSTRPIHRLTELGGNKYGNKIVDIEITDKVTEMRCIKVSNPDQLYVTDGFVVTHNTTTATVLAEAIVRYTHEYCAKNPKVSPQRVVRLLEKIFNSELEPAIRRMALKPDEKMLHAVAKCSANGDQALADAIMQCFELTGDDGNITILEKSGPSKYEVEILKGYPVGIGYEDSCMRFFPMFLNDRENNRVMLQKPVFILNFGTITDISQLFAIMEPLAEDFSKWLFLKKHPEAGMAIPEEPPTNVVVVATGFSESVLGNLGKSFQNPDTLNIIPVLVPKTPIQNGAMHFLQDLQALTGATIFDPIRRPLSRGVRSDVGHQIEYFEMNRYRSNAVGVGDEGLLMARVEEVRKQIENEAYESQMEHELLKERLGKLTGGIAKLTVVGASNGEIREKKDRAEDAACAVRGALKHGCLPGGCWALEKLCEDLNQDYYHRDHEKVTFEEQVVFGVLIPSLREPFQKLLSNCGFSEDEINETKDRLSGYILDHPDRPMIYDALEQKFVPAAGSGVMDSTPAVLEAVRNSISIASLLGTLGGAVVFPRDNELERQEASETMQFVRDANTPSTATQLGDDQ